MPIKNSNIKQESLAAHKQLSYEQLVTACDISNICSLITKERWATTRMPRPARLR